MFLGKYLNPPCSYWLKPIFLRLFDFSLSFSSPQFKRTTILTPSFVFSITKFDYSRTLSVFYQGFLLLPYCFYFIFKGQQFYPWTVFQDDWLHPPTLCFCFCRTKPLFSAYCSLHLKLWIDYSSLAKFFLIHSCYFLTPWLIIYIFFIITALVCLSTPFWLVTFIQAFWKSLRATCSIIPLTFYYQTIGVYYSSSRVINLLISLWLISKFIAP